MLTITLNIDQRFNLELLLAQQTGNIGKVLALSRVMETTRVSDEDKKLFKFRIEGEQFRWDRPASNPTEEFSIEDADARHLLAVIDSYDHFVPNDTAWVGPIRAALKAND
jgi:hypothetical protein